MAVEKVDNITGQTVTYDNTDGMVDVRVRQTRLNDAGDTQVREYIRDYHEDEDAPKRALKFTYEIESGEAPLDKLLPAWDGDFVRRNENEDR